MRFSLFYELQLPRPWDEGAEERLMGEALEQIELADRLGFDRVWEVEHHFLEEYAHSSAPEVFLAAASQRTERIRLGHGIVQLPPPINHPARTAERVATLDLLSGGRVDLGTGEGSSQVELGAFGVRRDAKREQWSEALEVIVRLLTEDPFTGHRGRWIELPPRNLVPKPKQRPHPPLWMACSRRETIEVAARHGLGALSFSFVDPEDAVPHVEAYERILTSDECVPIGRSVNPNLAVTLPFMCHEDESVAIERGIDGAHFFGYSLAHYYVFGEHRPGRTDLWEEFDRYRHERGFAREIIRAEKQPLGMRVLQDAVGSLRGAVGTPEQLTDLVSRYQRAGVDEVILVAQAGRNRHEHICEALELFAERVMPRFVEGREEREARRAERLAPAIEAALARRARVPDRDVGGYAISPAGEFAPTGEIAPRTGGGVDVRRRAEDAGLAALRAVVSRVDDRQLERVVGSGPGMRTLFTAIVASLDPEAAGDLDATIRFQLRADGTSHTWGLRIRDGRASARAGEPPEPDVTIGAELADFLRIAVGEIAAGRAVMDERLRVVGDVGVASRMLTAFAPSGGPW